MPFCLLIIKKYKLIDKLLIEVKNVNIDISRKVVVITSASKGIGAALASAFAKEQAYVVINYCHRK